MEGGLALKIDQLLLQEQAIKSVSMYYAVYCVKVYKKDQIHKATCNVCVILYHLSEPIK